MQVFGTSNTYTRNALSKGPSKQNNYEQKCCFVNLTYCSAYFLAVGKHMDCLRTLCYVGCLSTRWWENKMPVNNNSQRLCTDFDQDQINLFWNISLAPLNTSYKFYVNILHKTGQQVFIYRTKLIDLIIKSDYNERIRPKLIPTYLHYYFIDTCTSVGTAKCKSYRLSQHVLYCIGIGKLHFGFVAI